MRNIEGMRKERRRESGDGKIPLHPGERKGQSNVTEIDGLEKSDRMGTFTNSGATLLGYSIYPSVSQSPCNIHSEALKGSATL